jgi:short-subunit dehydrogenase
MMNIAIITGASSGLGREYVRAVAEKMPELDEIWLIARRQQRLIDLAHTLPGHRFRILPYDLTTASSFRKLRGLLARENPDVWLLINDAGAMYTGPVAAMSLVNQEELITLHAVAPTRLVHLALPYMNRGSAIINVTSIGGFAPVQNMSVYSASKAYLISYTEGLHAELRSQGIHVMALAPGIMRTSQANAFGGITKYLPALNLPAVTRRSLNLVICGQLIYTPGLLYKAYRLAARVTPDTLWSYVNRF